MALDIGSRLLAIPETADLPCLGSGGRVESGFFEHQPVVGA